MKWFLLIAIVASGACKPKDDSAPAPTPSTAGVTAQATDQPDEKIVWAIDVDGRPQLSGASVERKENSAGGQVVTFFGAPIASRLDLSSTGELQGFRLRYTEDGVTCVHTTDNTATNITFSLTGNRGEFEGEIPCGPSGKDDEAKPVKMSGWFEASLKQPPKFEATDFKPGKDGKIKLTKDGPEVSDE